MYPHFRTFRGHPEWNGRSSYPGDFRFANDQDFNSAHGLRKMSRCEREEVHRRAQGWLQDPYSTPRQCAGLNATENVYATNDAERRERRCDCNSLNVDDLAHDFAGLSMGTSRSRGNCSSRNVCWNDEYMPAASEAPRVWPRNGEYYLNRACRRSNTYQDNYNDAYQYMHGQNPCRHTMSHTRHDTREYAGLKLRFGTAALGTTTLATLSVIVYVAGSELVYGGRLP